MRNSDQVSVAKYTPYFLWQLSYFYFHAHVRHKAEKLGRDYTLAIRANPALTLLPFFHAQKFAHGAEVTVLMPTSTEKAAAASVTLDNLPELGEDMVMLWISTWRSRGLL